MKKYLINCFVRKNNKLIRDKLEEIGIRKNSLDSDSGEWIANSYGIYTSVNPEYKELHPDDIDCGRNGDLFLGLSSITDETDIDINSLKRNLSCSESICWKCMYACDVNNSLKNDGYCGCMFMLTKGLITFLDEDKSNELLYGNIDAHELCSGWIYNKRSPYGFGIDIMSGMMTNNSLITKGCTSCKYFRRYE